MISPQSKLRLALASVAIIVACYGLLAYVVLPFIWTHYEHQKGLAGLSMLTQTAQGIHGDPINVGLVGTSDDVLCAMHAAGWYPADPITFKSSLKIIGSVVLDVPYRDAPVSNLFYQGKREDLAFERPDGPSADRRHHVRFWQVLAQGEEGRPVWLGAVTFDRGVGVSHYTAQVTHHIAPDIDAGRTDSSMISKPPTWLRRSTRSPVSPLVGRNGGSDLYYTDGRSRFRASSPAVARKLRASRS